MNGQQTGERLNADEVGNEEEIAEEESQEHKVDELHSDR